MPKERKPRSPWTLEYYVDARGDVPVREALMELLPSDKARVLRVIELLRDYGTDLKMPHARPLKDKLWELRVDGRPNSYRVLYAAVAGRKFLLLHLFAKKTQETPQRELDTATRRLKEYERGRKGD
jgi:phage-related protein